MYDIDYIKKMYCRYKCNAKSEKVFVAFDWSTWCEECQEYKEDYVEQTTEIGDDACSLCQIDNFLKELVDYKIIKY